MDLRSGVRRAFALSHSLGELFLETGPVFEDRATGSPSALLWGVITRSNREAQ